jgi:eukaryotic-like serine/threonine-protein kinase
MAGRRTGAVLQTIQVEPSWASTTDAPRTIGRYCLYGKLASGGMATVHLGKLLGPVGFSRTVAIKKLHPHLAEDTEFVSMFLDEARLAARIRHPNVLPTLDVVATDGEFFLVMDYVQGETLSRLIRQAALKGETVPLPIVGAIFSGILHGLHAAHEAKNERGEPLGVVHRDVSPQNVMVGLDGVPRVLDFGVAKATGRLQKTREGQIKGKIAYMSPEQIQGGSATRLTDVYAVSVLLWETLTGKRLFHAPTELAVLQNVLDAPVPPASTYAKDLPPGLDAIIARGLQRDPTQRYATARELAAAIEGLLPLAIPVQVGEWVERMADKSLANQAARIAEIESSGVSSLGDASVAPVSVRSGTRTIMDDVTEQIEMSPHSDVVRVQTSRAVSAAIQEDADLTTVEPSHATSLSQGAARITDLAAARRRTLLRSTVAGVVAACTVLLIVAFVMHELGLPR